MDVGHTDTSADDHNINQNEATLGCALHMSDALKEGTRVQDDVNPKDRENTDATNKGMCTEIPQLTKDVELKNIVQGEHTFIIEKQVDSTSNTHDAILENPTQLPDISYGSLDNENITVIPYTSNCETPSRNVQEDNCSYHSNGTLNESSAVDISVTSEEDSSIKVTCRCSSTPVNYSSHKIDGNDCSIPSVGNTSPISCIDHEAKSPPSHQKFNEYPANEATPSYNKIDSSSMVAMQTPVYQNNNLEDDKPPPNSLEYTPRYIPYYTESPGSNYLPNYLNPPPPPPPPPPRPYSAPPYDIPPFFEAQRGYSDCHPCGTRPMTDALKSRHDFQMSQSSQPDLCCYPIPLRGMSDREYFVYPSIYVSNAGLISVLLRNDMSVEMTVDRTIRVVSHNHMMAVATDSKGTAASLYHPAVKIFQMGYNTDIATETFRAKMSQGEAIFFSNGASSFKLQESELQPMAPIKFSDIHRDQSVNLLFSSEGYGESLVATSMQVASQAEYANLPRGGVIVRINGVKVTQSGCGDVTVVTGAKFIRLSPHSGTTRLGNRFVDIEVERDWSVKLTRGTNSFVATKKRTMVSNGKMEAGFNENNGLKVVNLQPRHPLLAEPNMARRTTKRPPRPTPPNTPSSTCYTPRRRALTPNSGRGGLNTC